MTTAQRAGSQIAENLRLSLSTALHSVAIIIWAIGAVPQWQPSGGLYRATKGLFWA